MEDVTPEEFVAFVKEMIKDDLLKIDIKTWERMYRNRRFRETYKQLKDALAEAHADATEIYNAVLEIEKQNNEYKEQLQHLQDSILDRNDVRAINTVSTHQKEVATFDLEIARMKDLAKTISLDKYDCYRVSHVKDIAECVQETKKLLDANPKDSKRIEENKKELYVVLFDAFSSTTKACRQFVESNKNLKKFGDEELKILKNEVFNFALKIDIDKKIVERSNRVAVLPRVA